MSAQWHQPSAGSVPAKSIASTWASRLEAIDLLDQHGVGRGHPWTSMPKCRSMAASIIFISLNDLGPKLGVFNSSSAVF
jgi:hypothetical protein